MKLLIALFFALNINAALAGQDTGGGDPCENRIQGIRNDIKGWILKGGAKDLKLPLNKTLENYTSNMILSMDNAKISCISQRDAGYPVEINGTPKICKFERNSNSSKITCEYEKFQALSESDQYVLIHHEYAGIADMESPNLDDSNYEISNQITSYLVDQVVKRLAVKMAPPQYTGPLVEVNGVKGAVVSQTLQDALNDTEFENCTMNIIGADNPKICKESGVSQQYFDSTFEFITKTKEHETRREVYNFHPGDFRCNASSVKTTGDSFLFIGTESGTTVIQSFIYNGFILPVTVPTVQDRVDFRTTFYLDSTSTYVTKAVFSPERIYEKNIGKKTNPKYVKERKAIWTFTCNGKAKQ